MKPIFAQRGATLITALVMMVVLTLLVVSAMRSSTTNMRITGNMQMQEEAVSAAQEGIEYIISNNFAGSPVASAVPVTYGAATYTAQIDKPVCSTKVVLPFNAPRMPSECYKQGNYDPNDTDQSSCAAQQWALTSSVNDPSTGASATVHQGVGVTVSISTSCT